VITVAVDVVAAPAVALLLAGLEVEGEAAGSLRCCSFGF